MTPFLSYLADKALPGWALLRNARISFHPQEGHRVSSFDAVYWSESIAELRSKIPQPTLLQTREALEMAGFRFAEEDLAAGNFSFDDLPSSLMSESSDMEVFGESWVIFWVVAPDLDMIVDYLTDKLEREAGERIEAPQLRDIWDDYVNRIFFRHDGDGDLLQLTLLYDQVQEALIERINASDKAPAESAWDILDEQGFLDGDNDW